MNTRPILLLSIVIVFSLTFISATLNIGVTPEDSTSVNIRTPPTTTTPANGSGNDSFNQALTDTLYDPLGSGSGNFSWNESRADLLYDPLGSGSGNLSWNESRADLLYATIGSAGGGILNDSISNLTALGLNRNWGGSSTLELANSGSLHSSIFTIADDTGDTSYESWVSGNAVEFFSINQDGRFLWGDGTNAVDTNLYRSSANVLKTDDSLMVGVEITTVNITITDSLYLEDRIRMTNLTPNSAIDGSVLGIMMTNPPNPEVPHFILQSGGGDQASVIVRSLMIVNENISILNSTDRTSCQAWADSYGIRRRVDCNTTTTGADLFVGDDAQFGGDVFLSEMDGDGTYSSMNDFFNIISSAGRISGGAITNPSGTNILVKNGTGMLRIADDDISSVKFIDWADSGNINVPTDSIMYFGVEYNGGSPQVINTTLESDFDLDTSFPLGQAINQKGEMYILSNPWWTADGLTNIIERFEALGHYSRDEEVGGLIPSATGTRNLAMTNGKVWTRLSEHDISAFDSSGADRFDYYYQDGAGGFNEFSDQSQWNVTSYDDGSGTLQPLTNNRYAVIWVFLNVASGKPSLIYPQAEHVNVLNAESEDVPIFNIFQGKGGFLLGRIIIQEGVDAPIEVQSAFTTQFTSAQASDHGNLAGLTDDDHTQYSLVNGQRNITGWDRFYYNQSTYILQVITDNNLSWLSTYNATYSGFQTNLSVLDLNIRSNFTELNSTKFSIQSMLDNNISWLSTYNATYANYAPALWINSSGNATFSSGNVGIGTASPNAKLDILGTTSDQLRLGVTGAERYKIGRSSSTGFLDFEGTQAGFTGYNFKNDDGSTDLTILDSGNVGIGTATPTHTLNVHGTLNISGNAYFDSNIGVKTILPDEMITLKEQAGQSGFIGFDDTNDADIVEIGVVRANDELFTGTLNRDFVGYNHVTGRGFVFGNVDGEIGRIGSEGMTSRERADLSAKFLLEDTDGNNIGSWSSARATNDIVTGTVNRDVVLSNFISGRDLHLVTNVGGTQTISLTVDGSNGNVGIGTTGASAPLHVVGDILITGSSKSLEVDSTNANVIIDRAVTSQAAQVQYQTADVTKWYAGLSSTDSLGDGTEFFIGEGDEGNGDAHFWIEADGKVGIGTNAPTHTLNVDGGMNVTQNSSIDGLLSRTIQTITIADDGAGTTPTFTINPRSTYIELNCLDMNSCSATLISETAVLSGTELILMNIGTNAILYTSVAGNYELVGGAWINNQDDILSFIYSNSRSQWIETSRGDHP